MSSKKCINCKDIIDVETCEYDETYLSKSNSTIYICEECLDYSTKNLNYYRNKLCKKSKKALDKYLNE